MHNHQSRPICVDFENYCQNRNRWQGFRRPARNRRPSLFASERCFYEYYKRSFRLATFLLKKNIGLYPTCYKIQVLNLKGGWIPRSEAIEFCRGSGPPGRRSLLSSRPTFLARLPKADEGNRAKPTRTFSQESSIFQLPAFHDFHVVTGLIVHRPV